VLLKACIPLDVGVRRYAIGVCNNTLYVMRERKP
jgi:hypothetical protein